MNIRAFLLLWFINYATAQDANCDFFQNVQSGNQYNISNLGYPQNYTSGRQCRWIANCPTGYNCRLSCTNVQMPQSPSCSVDRLVVSRSGDPQLAGAETHCGTNTFTAISTGQRISVGLISSQSSPGGSFTCELTARPISNNITCSCGYKRQDRIVGGQETRINEFPMMAGIVYTESFQIKCGGVILSVNYVLTAAHCMAGRITSNTAVLVGAQDVNINDSPVTQFLRVQSFNTHPQYNPSNYDYNVAVIKVSQSIVFSGRVGPVCLPFKYATNTDFSGSKLTLLGWGASSPGGSSSSTLQKVEVDVINQARCRSLESTVTDRQMCTLTPEKGACQGDLGGPALYTDPTTGLLFNVGVISNFQTCGPTAPNVITRVNAVLDWIVKNIVQDRACKK